MATTITENRIATDASIGHHAFPWSEDGATGWAVTYLPGIYTRDQAITAMMIVEFYKADGGVAGKHAPFIRDWAAELGVTVEQIDEALLDNC